VIVIARHKPPICVANRKVYFVFCEKKRELLVSHAAGRALHAAHLEIEIDLAVAATEITRPAPTFVVEMAARFFAAAANRFF